MSYKNLTAEKTTVTRDTIRLEEKTGNIYQSIVVVSKRANQISATLKEELTQKLQEFNTTTDNLEEVFENREQIEISRHYERMAKPTAIATQELLENKLFINNPEE
ncbi:MAG: DNA-directed RNA polymerase subunit omega [Bacteroidetes bacterium]|nr:DNA-directed RNA polymerase subunit omega [Bacteroidota bacterium]